MNQNVYPKHKIKIYRQFRKDIWVKLNRHSKCRMNNLEVMHLCNYYIKFCLIFDIDLKVIDLSTLIDNQYFAAYPQKLVEFLLSCSCPKGGLVLDPFAGSGTTLIVAYRMGFDYYGIELVPKYVDIIKKRIAKYCSSSRLDKYTGEDK